MCMVHAQEVISHACALPTVGMQHRQGGFWKVEAGVQGLAYLPTLMCNVDCGLWTVDCGLQGREPTVLTDLQEG